MTIKNPLFWIVILLCIGGFVYGWNVEWFQKKFAPEEYWLEQVSRLEDAVSIDQTMVRNAAIELKKFQMTMKLQVAQEINATKALGFSTEEAQEYVRDTIIIEIDCLRYNITIWKENLKKDRDDLEKARNQLSRYQLQ